MAKSEADDQSQSKIEEQADDQVKWTIKKELTAEEVRRHYVYLDKKDVETHILSRWDKNKIRRVNTDSTRIMVKDVDTGTTHELLFRVYKDEDPVIEGHWRRNFVERRFLGAGDHIGFCYEKTDTSELCFKVLKRRESELCFKVLKRRDGRKCWVV